MENNGRGIFYGVIGVATLVVAVIGATFAFFSASIASDADAVKAGSQTVAGTLKLAETKNLKTGLVPVDSDNALFANYIGTAATKCVDDNNNDICSVYQFKITNTANVAQVIGVNLVATQNNFGHLNYALYAGTSDFAKSNALKTAQLETDFTKPIELLKDVTLAAADDTTTGAVKEVTYTLVLWIEEAGVDQTTADAAKAFAAGINIGSGSYDSTSGAYTGGITGVLSTGA